MFFFFLLLHLSMNFKHFEDFQPRRVDQVTSAAFGGETLQDLYLTTAREDFDEAKSQEFPWLGKAVWNWGFLFLFQR